MVHIHVCLVRFVRFGTHLWLNFDLKAAAEPTGLLQRRAGDPTHRLEDPLSHLLHDKTAVIITAESRCALITTTAATTQHTCRSRVSFLFSRFGSLLTKSLRILQDRTC